MIAINLQRRRIVFTVGLTDAVKFKLIRDMWKANKFMSKFQTPSMYKYMKMTRPVDMTLDDVVYF